MKFNFSIPQVNFASISNLQQTLKFSQMKEQVSAQQGDPNFRGTYADDPQNITNRNPAEWKKIVPVPDKVKQDIIDALRKEFEEAGGMGDENSPLVKVKLRYLNSIPKTERTSAGWTLDQIQFAEAERMRDFIKSKDPSWDWGKPVKSEILAEAYKNPSIDIKA